jgi:hypothetical protein
MIVHIALLIHALAREGCCNDQSSILMLVTLLVVAGCFISQFLHPSDDRSNLAQARIHFASSLLQSMALTGLLVAYAMAQPRTYLVAIHSVNT